MLKNIFYLCTLSFLAVSLSGCGKTAAPTYKVEDKGGIPMETVAEHASAENCWIVVNNNVYNVADYIASHPGGKSMVDFCGKDATESFDSKPGSGRPHSDKARSLLEKYYIGNLKK